MLIAPLTLRKALVRSRTIPRPQRPDPRHKPQKGSLVNLKNNKEVSRDSQLDHNEQASTDKLMYDDDSTDVEIAEQLGINQSWNTPLFKIRAKVVQPPNSSTKRCSSKFCNYVGGCSKFAQGGTRFCITHGGGRLCIFPGCARSAQGGDKQLCIGHGGGKRCQVLGCNTSARGSSGLCVLHGGGMKCKHTGGCSKSAQRPSDFCIAHGGGRRCQFKGCNSSMRGRTNYCVTHQSMGNAEELQ